MTSASGDAVRRALEPELIVGDAGPGDPLDEARGVPMVAPRNVDELRSVMACSSREGWKVRPVGRATSLPPGFLDQATDLVVTTRLLTTIHRYEPADLTLTADAGVTLSSITGVTREAGQWLPLDPAKRDARTLGGVLASGAFGPLHAGFGSPRDHVLGVTLVTGDGRLLELGGQVVKNVAGYDLVKLSIGSRGRLGILVSATVRLHPIPPLDVTLLFEKEGVPEAVAIGRALAKAPVPVAAIELMTPAVAPDGWRSGRPGGSGGATVAVRILGSAESARESERILIAAVGQGADHRLEGPASVHWFESLERLEDDSRAVARLGHHPSRLGELIQETVETGDVAAHVAAGIVRVVFRDDEAGDAQLGDPRASGARAVEARAADTGVGGDAMRHVQAADGGAADGGAADALVQLRDRAAAIAGSFRVTRSNGLPWPSPVPAPSPVVRELIDGIVRSFDPNRVLADTNRSSVTGHQ